MISVEVNIVRWVDLPTPDDARIEAVVRRALIAEAATGEWAIAVVLVDDDELRRLHREFMGVDEPTDVMTFPAGAEEGEPAGGDIIVSVDRARDQGREHGLTQTEEIEFLIVHGVLHLCNWDDSDPERRSAMLDRQAEILKGVD